MVVGIKVGSDGSKGENSCHVVRQKKREWQLINGVRSRNLLPRFLLKYL